MDELLTGVEVGPPAHGGHCVARVEGRVVFVRHAAPGEVVDVRLTDAGEGRRFWRGDAVAVHAPSPDRVPSPWPEAGPGGAGGGELAHLALPAQRRWKAQVVRETLARIGHLGPDDVGEPTVVALADDDARGGLGTRTRIDLVLGADSRPGMYRHRSHDVAPLTTMPLAVEEITSLDLFAADRWDDVAPGTRIDVVAPSDGPVVVLCDGHVVDPQDPAGSLAQARSRATDRRSSAGRRGGAGRRPRTSEPARVSVGERVTSAVGDLSFRVDATGFWQVHRYAPATLVDAVLAAAQVQPGQRVLDLYSGAGLFTLPLALAAGEQGRVDALEVNARAVKDARRNLHAVPQAVLHATGVTGASLAGVAGDGQVDVVVLDPPRSGAGTEVMAALAELRPGRVVYVACDPAALARDLRSAVDHGYRVTSLQGYDLFPHTHHVECVAVLEPR